MLDKVFLLSILFLFLQVCCKQAFTLRSVRYSTVFTGQSDTLGPILLILLDERIDRPMAQE